MPRLRVLLKTPHNQLRRVLPRLQPRCDLPPRNESVTMFHLTHYHRPILQYSLQILFFLLLLLPIHSTQAKDLSEKINFTALAFDDGMGRALRSPASIFYDTHAQEILVADAGNNRVLIYDKDLRPLYSFEHFVKDRYADRMIKGEPKAVVANSSGDLIIIDNLVSYLDILDFRGNFQIRVFLNALLGDTTLNIRPECLAIDQNDNLYIVTAGDLVTVVVLDQYYNLKRTIGKKGGAKNEFNTLVGIAVTNEKLFVSDIYAIPAVKVFDTLGNYLLGFGGHNVDKSDLSLPSGMMISIDSASNSELIWTCDALRQVVKVFDSAGNFLANIGGFGYSLGEFRYPANISGDGKKIFYIVEKVGGRIQRFEFK